MTAAETVHTASLHIDSKAAIKANPFNNRQAASLVLAMTEMIITIIKAVIKGRRGKMTRVSQPEATTVEMGRIKEMAGITEEILESETERHLERES